MGIKEKPPAASSAERAKGETLECNNIAISADVPITNAQFLGALFHPGDTCWTTHFRENPSDASGSCWSGQACLPEHVADTTDRNAYFSVASFKGPSGRTYANFNSLVVVVLDDAQGCPLDPSWRLRTSIDKEQIGYRLAEPIADAGIAKRLHEQLARAGHIPLDRNGNNPVRYVRLPIGVNTKRDPPYACQLEVFQPELSYSTGELIEGLELDADYILHGKGEAPRPSATADGAFPEGARNTTLTSFAGSMRRRGMSEESILAALTVENADRCFPPLPVSEVTTIARSVAGYAPADVPGDSRDTPAREKNFEAPYLDALWDEDPAIDWMVYGLLESGVVAELWGPSGSYKTFFALDVAVSVASGEDWHGHKVQRQGPVLFIPGEGQRGIKRRLKVLCQERGLGRDTKIRIAKRPVALAQLEQANWLRDEIAKFDVPPVLIVVDTLARNFGGNENSAQDMGAFLDNVDMVCKEYDATGLIIHHCGHDGKHARGSYALFAGIDAEYQAIPDKANNSLQIENKKMKEAESGEIFYFNVRVISLKDEINGEVLMDSEGNPITSIVLETGDSGRATRQREFLKKHASLKGTSTNKYDERLPIVLQAAFDDPGISDRAVAKLCGVTGHGFVKTLKERMQQEGLLEGQGFQLTSIGREACGVFCVRADFQMNAQRMPKGPFPPTQKADLL